MTAKLYLFTLDIWLVFGSNFPPLEKTITPLMSEVERLNGLLEVRSKELAQLQAIRTKQQEELNVLQQQSASKSSEIFAQFGEIGERFGACWMESSRV